MITNSDEYWKLLYLIQDRNNPAHTAGAIPPIPVPSDESLFAIDLDSRTIEAPEFLSVKYDHKAETIFFIVDRYYDNMDLANTCCVIQFINAENNSRIYPVPFYDTVSRKDKLIFPWQIEGEATKKEGIVEFSVRFYTIDVDHRIFTFSLNTQPTSSKVLYGINVEDEEVYDYEATVIDDIYDRLARLEREYQVYWLEVE